jgi:hypothetical protein
VLPLSHVILHVGFCSAIARLRPQTTVAVRVHLADSSGRTRFDRTFRVERGDDPEAIVEFDSSFGVYRIDVSAPAYRCSTSDFLIFIPDHTRSITETLSDAPVRSAVPVLLSGTAPQSFLYVTPTFVVFDKSAAVCNKPVPTAIPTHIAVENDQDAYYAWLYNDDPARAPNSETLALRLRTPTHLYHYVRIPMPFPIPTMGWPTSIQLNVTEEMVDGLATEPTNTLLCPKMWRTSVG